MQLANIVQCVRLIRIQIFILSCICFQVFMSIYLFNLSKSCETLHSSVNGINEAAITSSSQAPIIYNCSRRFKVAFTFDDGPHPTYTSLIVKTLHRNQIKAGFFLLGTSIQSFLSAQNSLSVHQFERPRVPFLLIQDYSLVEDLFDGHDIYLHGWLHEKINEMRLQTVIDNIATELLEIGLLKGFKPVYRAPWGIGTSPGHVKNKALLPQILNYMGVIPAFWNVDTKDYLTHVDENTLIYNTLQMICKVRGGLLLMHDNRPTTAYCLDRLIRSIQASNHTIVSPGEIDGKWYDQNTINRTRRYTEFLRQRARKLQNSILTSNKTGSGFRPVEVSFPTHQRQGDFLRSIEAVTRYSGPIKVSPNIHDV